MAKDGNAELACKAWSRIKSEKVYEVLKCKGRPREAMELAFKRRDKVRL